MSKENGNGSSNGKYPEVLSSISIYMSEEKPDLLSLDEEVVCAKRIENGVEARRLLRDGSENVDELVEIIQKGQEAREILIGSNLRLSTKEATKLMRNKVELGDLIQEGNIGLIVASERFDYRKGFRFSTYATWWVRHYITKYIADNRSVIRKPVYFVDSTRKLINTTNRLSLEMGREPEIEELIEELNMSPKRIERILKNIKEPLSLDFEDEGKNGEGNGSLLKFVDDIKQENPEEYAEKEYNKVLLREMLNKSGVTAREEKVLKLRYFDEMTYVDIGNRLGVVKERVRQIEASALLKLNGYRHRKHIESPF